MCQISGIDLRRHIKPLTRPPPSLQFRMSRALCTSAMDAILGQEESEYVCIGSDSCLTIEVSDYCIAIHACSSYRSCHAHNKKVTIIINPNLLKSPRYRSPLEFSWRDLRRPIGQSALINALFPHPPPPPPLSPCPTFLSTSAAALISVPPPRRRSHCTLLPSPCIRISRRSAAANSFPAGRK